MSLARWTLLVVALAALALPAAAMADHAGPLAAQYHLDSKSTTATEDITPDSSGHGLDLTTGDNNIELTSPGKFGANHLSNVFFGDRLDTPSVPLLKPQQVTLMAWVRQEETNSANDGQIAGHVENPGQFSGCGASYSLVSRQNGGVEFGTHGTLEQDVVSPNSGTAVWDNQWHLFAGVYDGQRVRLYVDGNQVGAGTPAPGLVLDHDPGDGFYVNGNGLEECGGASVNGTIDEVRVYRRALSGTEIGRLAAAPDGGAPPVLVPDSPPPSGGAGGSAPPVAKIQSPVTINLGGLIKIGTLGSFGAKEFRFDVNSDGANDAVCPAHAPTLETRLRTAGTKRLTLTVVSASGQLAKATTKTVVTGKIKSLRRRTNSVPQAFKCVHDVKTFPRVDFTAIGDTGGSGGPPSGCASTLQFDYIQAVGCLERVRDVSDIPKLELPILDELIRKWNSTPALREVILGPCKEEIKQGKRPKGSCPAKEVINRSQTKAMLGNMDLHISRRPVRINGIDFTPAPGSAIVLAPQISRVLSFAAAATIGHIPIKAGRINLDVEKGRLPGGQNIRDGVHLGFFRADKSKTIAGFGLDGSIDVTMGDNFISLKGATRRYRSYIKARLRLPKQLSFGGGQPASLAVDLRTDNQAGLQLDNIQARVPSVFAGPVRIANAYFNYFAGPKVWEAGGTIFIGQAAIRFAPPPALNGIRFERGAIKNIGANLVFAPPIPPPQPFPGVFIDEIGFGIRFDPTVLRGEIVVSALKTARIRGAVLVAFPSASQPYTLTSGDAGAALAPLAGRTFRGFTIAAGGQVNIVIPAIKRELPLGNGYFLYSDPGYLALGGSTKFDYPGMSIEGSVNGEYSIPRNAFNLGGRVRACIFGLACPGLEALVSSRGIAACGEITIDPPLLPTFTARPGAGYRYGDSWPTIWLIDGCKTSPYRAQVARASQAGVRTVTIRKGLPSAMIRLDGRAGAAPRVKVTAPGGETISSIAGGANGTQRLRILGQDPPGITWIGVQRPAAGRYRIELLPGSTPITRVSTADGLPPAKIRARLRGKGTRRTLSYSVLRRAGQRVVFEEQGSTTARIIGSTTGGKGSLRFKPSVGPGGTRRIVARVELDGLPSEKLTIARFRVRNTITPGRVRRLRVKRSRRGVSIRFRAAVNARRYQVLVKRRDGAARLIRTRRRALRVKLPRTQSGRVYVMAVGPTDLVGRPRSARFKFNLRPVTKFQKYKRGKGKIKRKRKGRNG